MRPPYKTTYTKPLPEGAKPAVLLSKAFQSLRTEAARQVFEIFLEKNAATKDKQVKFTYAEAERHGMLTDKFRLAIDQLVKAGLIDIVGNEREGGYHFPVTLYALSNRWKNYGRKCFRYRERPKRKSAPAGSLTGRKYI